MTGGRRILASVNALLVVLACGGGRETDTPATVAQASDTAAAPARDTSTAAAADTAAAAPAAPARDTSAPVAQKPVAKPAPPPKPAPRPAPKQSPPAPTPAPAETTAAAPAAEAGLRDAYHQAPRDTVTPEVYEGWKQFNLNCARCHGEDVLGTTIAPHLITSVRPGGAVAAKEAFVQVVCAGRPEKGMPAWCPLGLEMEKINAIHAYVMGRSEGKIAPGRPARKE